MISKYKNRQFEEPSYFTMTRKWTINQTMRQTCNPIIKIDRRFWNGYDLPSSKLMNPRGETLTYVDDIYCFCDPIQAINQSIPFNAKWCCCSPSVSFSSDSTNFSPLKMSLENSLNHIIVDQEYFAEENNSFNMRGDLEEEKTLNSENIIKISLLSDSESDDESFVLNKIYIKNKSNKKKSTQLKFRNDVIFKTIFRSFRKHYIRDFKTYFDFIKQKGDSIRLIRKVKEYLIHCFGFENELLCAIFICIIDTRHKYSQVNENYEDVATKINDLMYNFSNNKMLELIDCDEFALIFQTFLRQPDIVNKVLKNRNDSTLKKTYKMHISKLLSLSSRN